MAASGYLDWSGLVATNARIRDYLQLQTVMVFADATARNSALSGVLSEGLHAFLLDTNSLTVYTGSAWSTVGPVHGALTSWTPAVVQSGAVTTTNSRSVYQRFGRRILAEFYVTCTGTGTGSNTITVSLPVTAASTAGAIGSGHLRDNSTGFNCPFIAKLASTTTLSLLDSSQGGVADANAYLGLASSSFAAALTTDDYIMGQISYDAGADA